MATRLHGILLDGLNKPIVNATVALIAKGSTITVLNGSEAIFKTDALGAYNQTVQVGHYKVIIGPQGTEPYKAGEIVIYGDSPEGSLNGYLINWAPEQLTPDVIKQVQQLVSNSEQYALQAGRSALAASQDATDARGSKTAAATSASEALVHKNDAKTYMDGAKTAQSSASGSANTASQAVTTVNQVKTEVAQLKSDTQTLKNAAAESERQAGLSKQAAAGSATEAGKQATNAAGSATRAETAATKAEQELSTTLKKASNLSDVANINTARTNLRVDGFDSGGAETRMLVKGDTTKYLFLNGDGRWGVSGLNALAVTMGGTGAINADDARSNLGLDRLKQPANDTYLYAGRSKVRLTLNSGFWGMYDEDTSSWIQLPIYAGGTGAVNKYEASKNMGNTVLNGATIGTSGDMNTYTGPAGSGGEFYNVAATNSHNVANWPTKPNGNKAYGWGALLAFKHHMQGGRCTQFYVEDTNVGLYFRHNYSDSTWRNWQEVWTSGSTTIDSSGFLKVASPIIKVFRDGKYETNIESEGAVVERVDVGVYRVTNVLGLNSDPAWGGPEGGFEIPVDRNSNPLVWLDYEVDADGSLLIKTYHRTNPNAPVFARNLIGYKDKVTGEFIETVKEGEPVDIPVGVFVSVRVQMPADCIYNRRLAEEERLKEEMVEKEPAPDIDLP